MHKFRVHLRYENGSCGEVFIMANTNYEATQQANAMYGKQMVMMVVQIS